MLQRPHYSGKSHFSARSLSPGRDPGITKSSIPNNGIGKTSPGLQSLFINRLSCRRANLKTSVITFVNAHTVWHYLQMAMLLSNNTLSIECYSQTSINCVFMLYGYFVSIVYSSLDAFYIINFMSFLHFIPCCTCVCHMCIKVPTYLVKRPCLWLTAQYSTATTRDGEYAVTRGRPVTPLASVALTRARSRLLRRAADCSAATFATLATSYAQSRQSTVLYA